MSSSIALEESDPELSLVSPPASVPVVSDEPPVVPLCVSVESPLPHATMETVIAATRIADKIFFFIFSSPF
jgi:hypothetical protein